MAVEFLTDEQAAWYGRFEGEPSQAELERFFFLDDADRDLVARRRGPQSQLGFVIWSPQAFVRDVHDVG